MKKKGGSNPGGISSIDPPPPMSPVRGTDERTPAPEFDFLRLASILRRRRKLIVAITAVGAITAGTISLLVAPKYTATAHVVVEPQRPVSSEGETPTPMDQAFIQSTIDTHVTMLASRDHLHRVLDSLSDTSESSAVQDSKPSTKVTTALPNDHLPPPAAIDGAVEAAVTINAHTPLSFQELGRRLKIWIGALAVKRDLHEFERGLRVMQERNSRVVSVSFTAKSPGLAAAVANRVVQLYVSGLAEQHGMQANEELAALDERAAQLKSELEKAAEGMRTLLSAQAPAVAAAAEGQQPDTRLRALEREAASSGEAYSGVLEREKEIRDQQDVVAPEVRILSLAAPPDRPSSVNPILFTLPALIAFLIGASLLAVMLERLDRGLRSEREVTKALGLPCIGLVPQLPRSYTNRPCHYLQNEPFTPYAEAIRSAVAALHLALPHRRPTTILVSSSVPGEGKTTVAVSLGVCAARLGRRTLLIDFDSRRPSVMRTLRGRSQANVEDGPLEQRIEHLTVLDLDYLRMSLGTADPLAPFMSTHMQRFLRQLGESYDCVFIDSPPLLGISETRLLAALVDSVIFVIKWGSTRREVVQNAGNMLRDTLECNGSHIVRALALVTQVDLKKHADYRYGDVGEAFAKYAEYYFGSAKAPETIEDGSQVGNDEWVEASAGSECAR
jgi:polysaccharide biosynthesis transport protein